MKKYLEIEFSVRMETYDKQFWVLILPNKFSVRIKHDEKFWVLILTKKFSVRIKHEWKFWVLILTDNFAVSIKSFYMLEF